MGFLSNLQRGSRLQSSVGKTGAAVRAVWNNPVDLRQMRGCLFHPLKASDLTSQRALGPDMTCRPVTSQDVPGSRVRRGSLVVPLPDSSGAVSHPAT